MRPVHGKKVHQQGGRGVVRLMKDGSIGVGKMKWEKLARPFREHVGDGRGRL